MKYELLKTVAPGFIQKCLVSVKKGYVAEMIRAFKPEFVKRIE